MIDVKCDCGEMLAVPGERAGEFEQCPSCKLLVPVPGFKRSAPTASSERMTAADSPQSFPEKALEVFAVLMYCTAALSVAVGVVSMLTDLLGESQQAMRLLGGLLTGLVLVGWGVFFHAAAVGLGYLRRIADRV